VEIFTHIHVEVCWSGSFANFVSLRWRNFIQKLRSRKRAMCNLRRISLFSARGRRSRSSSLFHFGQEQQHLVDLSDAQKPCCKCGVGRRAWVLERGRSVYVEQSLPSGQVADSKRDVLSDRNGYYPSSGRFWGSKTTRESELEQPASYQMDKTVKGLQMAAGILPCVRPTQSGGRVYNRR
jgi:hypothetical protein